MQFIKSLSRNAAKHFCTARAVALAALLGGACASLSSCPPTADPAAAQANQVGLQEISNVALPSVSGPQRRLRDFRGQIVMLHFFSSWCGQCRLEAPTLRNVHNSFKDSKFTVVGVAVDDDPFEMQKFVSQ